MGLVALWHVESSWTRDWTHVPCIGRRILNHCTTRETLFLFLLLVLLVSDPKSHHQDQCQGAYPPTFLSRSSMVSSLTFGNSLAVQWLGLHAFTAEGPGSVPGRGTKIPQTAWQSQEKKKKSHVQVFNPFWVIFCIWCKIGVQFHSFACGCPVFPAPFIEETVLSFQIYLFCIHFNAMFSENRWLEVVLSKPLPLSSVLTSMIFIPP